MRNEQRHEKTAFCICKNRAADQQIFWFCYIDSTIPLLRAGPRDVVARGGGALKAKVLNRAAKAPRGGSMRRG